MLDASSTNCAKLNLNTKVLDFVQLGGPEWAVDSTVLVVAF